MSDTGEAPFVKLPPAAIFDTRLKGFDLRVLARMSQVRNFKTDITDHSTVQLAQDFNCKRQVVSRSVAKLVTTGYLKPLGRNSRHAHRYLVNFANGAPGPLLTLMEAKASPEVHAPQEVLSPCTSEGAPAPQEVLSHAPPEVHSSGKASENNNNRGSDGAPTAGAPVVDWWELPLLESDFGPSTRLVQEARDRGFARDEGGNKDALQVQRRVFFRLREKYGYEGHATHREFITFLEGQARKRAARPKPAPVKTNRTDDFEPIPDFLRHDRADASPAVHAAPKVHASPEVHAPPKVHYTPHVHPGAVKWRAAYGKALDALATKWGPETIGRFFGAAVLHERGGQAVLIVPGRGAIAAQIRNQYGDDLHATWSALPDVWNVPLLIVGEREKLPRSGDLNGVTHGENQPLNDGRQAHAAEPQGGAAAGQHA
jgi:hypothetical protein